MTTRTPHHARTARRTLGWAIEVGGLAALAMQLWHLP
jgi:hypothetical protein